MAVGTQEYLDRFFWLPVDIVLAPEWWYKNTGITFDRDFLFHPLKRVESEQRMEKELYERWGKYGLGADRDTAKPEIGAVHLAAGFMLSTLHSECSHTMISCDDYEQFLMPIDAKWSLEKEYFGIHYCGNDPHRYAESFKKIPKLDFLDVGWGRNQGYHSKTGH